MSNQSKPVYMKLRDMIAAAALPAKRQHKLALEQALREVEEENASLQSQYFFFAFGSDVLRPQRPPR